MSRDNPGRGNGLRILCLAACLLGLCSAPVAAQVTHGPPRVRQVYIPADQLHLLFENASKGVLMPREKIMALWAEGQQHVPSDTAAPADVVLSQAAYQAQLGDHELRVTGRIQIAKLRSGWQTVDLPFGGLAIESAQLSGQPARFGLKDDGTPFLVLEKEGRFELQLEISVPLASKGGDLAATLKLPPVPASEILLRLDKGKNLQTGETTLQSDSGGHGPQQLFRVAVGQTGLVPLLISERFAGGNRAPLVLVNSHSIDRVEPAGLRWEVVLDLDVYARATDAFQIQLPDTVDLVDVEAPDLERWTIGERQKGTSVTILKFRKPFLGRRTARLLGLASVPPTAEWDVPTVKVLESASHVGQVAVHGSPSLRVEVGKLSGIAPQRLSSDAARAGTGDTPLRFAFWEENFKLPLRVTERRRAVQASVATLVEVDRAGVALRSSVTIQPRHAPVFDVQLLLPQDWDVTSVLSANQPVQWESSPRTSPSSSAAPSLQRVRFDLAKPLKPGQSLEVAVTAQRHPEHWLEADDRYQDVALPELRLVGADEIEGTLLVQAPSEIELLVSELSDDLHPVAAASPTATARTSGTVLQYRYQDDSRLNGRLQVRMKPAKVSAETLAFVRLDRGKLDMHYQLDLHIQQGTLRKIGFTLPAAVGEKLQIVPVATAARVIEQRSSPLPKAGDNTSDLSLWQIVLDRPVTGELTLALDFGQTCGTPETGARLAEAKADKPDSAEAACAAVPVLAVQNVSRQSGMVAVEAASDQQIDCTPKNLRELDPADVLKPKVYVPTQRIVAAYQYPRLPYQLAIKATRHTPGSVLTGICEATEILSVAGYQGRMRHQSRFWLRSLNLPHVPVTLPENADLWSVMLDNTPVEVRRNQGTYLVPLPTGQAAASGAPRELTLIYETADPRPAAGNFWERVNLQTVRQSAPEIGLTTLATTWRIYPPPGTEAVFTEGDFKPETPLSRPTLAAGLAEAVARHSTSGWSWKLGGLLAAAVVVGFFALINSGKGCGVTVVQVLVTGLVILVLIGLLLPATQSAREAGRRMACTNNLKQIGLALHNYAQAYGRFPPAVIGPKNLPRERQFSWLVALLPFLELKDLYDQLRLDLPYDHPHNAAVLQSPLKLVQCPSDQTQESYPKTSYVAVTGADFTAGSGKLHGIIGWDKGLSFGEIVDGLSNTIMVAEVADGGAWFAGGHATARRIDDWIATKTWSQHGSVGNVLLGDGSVRAVSSSIDPQILRWSATAQGMEPTTKCLDDSSDDADRETAPAVAKSAASPSVRPTSPVQEIEEANLDAAVQTIPEDKPSPQAPRPSRVVAGERGRLSLGLVLETDKGEPICLRCEGGSGKLVLGLQDRLFAQTLEMLIVAAALLVAWMTRRVAGSRRAIAVVIGIALPIGLSGLVPLAWTPILDGLLLGALAASGLWILVQIVAPLKTSPLGSASGAAIIIGLVFAPSASMAAEKEAQDHRASTVQDRRPDLTLFVPYDPDREKPLEKTQVYLPHQEFLRLWKLAHPDEPLQAPPKVRAVVSFAEYSGRLEKDVARFDGRLLVHHLVDGWTKVELPLGNVALERIEINGRSATLAGGVVPGSLSHMPPPVIGSAAGRQEAAPKTGTSPAIYLDKVGHYVVDLRFSVPVRRLGATGQMTVPLRPVSSGRLLFQLPPEDLELQVTGAAGGWRRGSAASESEGAAKSAGQENRPVAAIGGDSVSIPLGAADELSLRWQPRRVEAREGQLLSVDHALLVEVLDSGVHFHSKFHYRVQQGAISKVRLRIPGDMAVQDVRGSEVADWSIEAGANNAVQSQQLVVSLKKELATDAEIDVHALRRDRQVTGAIDLHPLEPVEVVRETGRVAIASPNDFRVRVAHTEGMDQINRTAFPLPQLLSPGSALLSAYRYTSRPWRLQLEVERHRSQVEVTNHTAVAVTARQSTVRSLLTAQVTGAPILSFGIRLPASLRVSQVRVPAGADWFINRDDKGQQLKVELSTPAIGRLDVSVSGTVPRELSQAELTVPGVIVEDVQAQRGQVAIYLDDDLQAVLSDDGGARPIDPAALASTLRPASRRAADYAFECATPPKNLRLRLASAPSRLNSDVTTVVSVREGAVAYICKVDFEIRQAGRSRFRVATPQWLGEDVELQGEQIRQVRSQVTGQQRVWDIELQQPVRGNYSLQLNQTLPLPEDGTVPAAMIQPQDVERERSHIVLENVTSDEIAATVTKGVEPLSTAMVPGDLADQVRRQAVAAYRILDDTAKLVWQRRVREQETGLMASITLADLTTVVHADGRYRARASYNIHNRTLQFLELELPPGSEVWSAHVSGQPVHPAKIQRQGRTITLLPLQKTSVGDFSSKVTMIYSGQLGQPLYRWSQVRPPAPQICSNVPVSRTLWTVLLPREYQVSLVKNESNLEEVGIEYQREERKLSFLDELRQMVQVASSKGTSRAQEKAYSNLKQVGVALSGYAESSARIEAKNAADVQEQAQQIQAEIGRLDAMKSKTKQANGQINVYFIQARQESRVGTAGGELDRSVDRFAEPDADKAVPSVVGKKPQVQPSGGEGQRRGDLRRQAAEQLEKLQMRKPKGAVQPRKADPQSSSEWAEQMRVPAADGFEVGDRSDEQSPQHSYTTPSNQPPPSTPVAASTGQLSLDLDLGLVGTAHYFRKLHGEPRLVLRARHEDISRRLSGVVWSVLCLALAAAMIQGLRQPDALTRARRAWPWLAAAIGAAWLFLLPAGVCGLVLLVLALCVLISRRRKRPATNPAEASKT